MRGVAIFDRACVAAAACVLGAMQTAAAAPQDGSTSPTGAIVGRVIFRGSPPPTKSVALDSTCARIAGAVLPDEALVVEGALGIRNVFVYVKEGLDATYVPDAPTGPVVLTQHGCRFEPRVIGVRVGQPLIIANDDNTLHDVHGTPAVNPQFNIGQPIAGMRVTRMFTLPEVMVPISSDIHPWMKAFVAVVPHSLFAVTQFDGVFTISGVPPGRYTVEAWHETLGTSTAQVAVAARQPATVSFAFAAR
jgi:hypothetical protein